MKVKGVFLKCSFFLEEQANGVRAELDNYSLEEKELIVFEEKTKKELKKKIKEWIKEKEKTNTFKKLREEEYAIEIDTTGLLKKFKNTNFAYHIAKTENSESIQKDGLVPNGDKNSDVYRPNAILDKLKPKTIDKSFEKCESVYLHTEITNDMLFEAHYYKNHTLFAVDIEDLSGYVGSIGISGFMLFDEEMGEEYNKKQEEKIKETYAKMYWKNAMTTKEYKTNKKKRKKINKKYGLDEVLICSTISPKKVHEIGYWGENGEFFFKESFDCFVNKKSVFTKEEVKSLY